MMVTLSDWRASEYKVEIAYVAFLGGYAAWIDDEPYNEGEPFRSKQEAVSHIRREFRS